MLQAGVRNLCVVQGQLLQVDETVQVADSGVCDFRVMEPKLLETCSLLRKWSPMSNKESVRASRSTGVQSPKLDRFY